ncbi:hypothetical protein BDN67DRAFT_491649 [Paxillus ammoniavirescens]|nr:hypothetical protein BDN67DRAFT_491649 [Paxillus ammoniavirescens]
MKRGRKTPSAIKRTRPLTPNTLYIQHITADPQGTTSRRPPLLLMRQIFNVPSYRCKNSLISFADDLMIRSTRRWRRGTGWTQPWRQVPDREFDSRIRGTGLTMLDRPRCCFLSLTL